MSAKRRREVRFFYKKIILIFCILAPLIIFSGLAAKTNNSDLKPAEDKNLWGYQASSGQFVIPPKYNQAKEFSEGLAAVKLGNAWGFINPEGVMVIRPLYLTVNSFSGGRALVCDLKLKNSFIDRWGKTVLSLPYELIQGFSEGLAVAQKDAFHYGYIDTAGKLAIPAIYRTAGKFSGGLACVKIGEKYGFINSSGTTVIPPKFPVDFEFCGELGGYFDSNGKGFVMVDNKGITLTRAEVEKILGCSLGRNEKPSWPLTALEMAKRLIEFRNQGERDALYKYSENSLLPPDYQPLAGEGVLLVAELRRWEGKKYFYYDSESPDRVRFEIVSGKGYLLTPDAYPPAGQTAGRAQSLEGETAPNGAAAWLVTDPKNPSPVTVKATLLSGGTRAPFLGDHVSDLFTVNPIPAPRGWDLDPDKIRKAEKENSGPGKKRVVYTNESFNDESMDPKTLTFRSRHFKRNGKIFSLQQSFKNGIPSGPATEKAVNEPKPQAVSKAEVRRSNDRMTHVNLKEGEEVMVLAYPSRDKDPKQKKSTTIFIQKIQTKYLMLEPHESMLISFDALIGLHKMVDTRSDPKCVKGHYYWSLSVNRFFPDLRGEPSQVWVNKTSDVEVE
jgi:hypothetical protein